MSKKILLRKQYCCVDCICIFDAWALYLLIPFVHSLLSMFYSIFYIKECRKQF